MNEKTVTARRKVYTPQGGFPSRVKLTPRRSAAHTWEAAGSASPYLQLQVVYFTVWLADDLLQPFGFHFHQIKQPLAVVNFLGPLNIQGRRAEVFKRFT